MKRKYIFLIETILGAGVILACNMIWARDNMGLVAWNPNPYWIVVILIAARYGSLQGMFAGLVASLFLLGSFSYDTFVKEGLSAAVEKIPYNLSMMGGLFIIFGFVIGEQRRRMDRILTRRQQQYDKLRNEFGNLAMDNMACKDINIELEGRILSQTETVNTLYEVARSLATMRVEDLYPSIIKIVKKIIAPEKCSLYIWEGENYVLRGQSGWNQDEIKGRQTLNLGVDIIKLARDEKKLVTVKDVFKRNGLRWEEKKDPPMVAPLSFGGGDNPVGGFIIIDDISFLKLNPDSIRFLAIMSDWVSRSFDNIYAATAVRVKDYYDDDLKVFNYNYAKRRLREEILNAQVSGNPSALMLVRVADFDKLDPKLHTDVLKVTGFVLKNTFRTSDVVAHHLTKDVFIVIFPGTNAEGLEMVTRRIKEQVEKFAFKPYGDDKKVLSVKVSTKLIGADARNEDELLRDAEKELSK